MDKKAFIAAAAISLFLLSLVFCFQVKNAHAQSRTIVVPTNYSTIQDAIGNATAGDIIFVKSGIYYPPNQFGEIVIDKPLSLIGENPNSTIIDGNYDKHFPRNQGWVTVRVASSNVILTGFTITNCEYAISVDNYGHQPHLSGITIFENTIMNCGKAIYHWDETTTNLVISGNNINSNGNGVDFAASNSLVLGNSINQHYQTINFTNIYTNGLTLYNCKNVTVAHNNITGWNVGLGLNYFGPFFVFDNCISGCNFGVQFGQDCSNASVHDNSINANLVGVRLENFVIVGNSGIGLSNEVYRNNLANFNHNALIEHAYPYSVNGTLNGTDVVQWDNGKVGNYWSDYLTKYPNATELDSTGIGNTPYVIDSRNIDNYPSLTAVNTSLVSPSQSLTPSPTQPPSPPPSPSSPTQQPTLEPSSTPHIPQKNLTSAAVIVGAVIAFVAALGVLAFAMKRRRPT